MSAAQHVLVTGATGFTGCALVERLVQQGVEVTAYVRPTSDVARLRELGVSTETVDITDPAAVASAMRPFDFVYHLAASYREEHADIDTFRRVNVDATRNLLRAAADRGVGRFIHCSTVGVQGEIEQAPATEEYRTKPGDHYQQSKLEGEQLALSFFADGLAGSVVRPVGIYGPGDRRFLKLFKAVDSGMFVMIGDGQTLYHMTYIDDLIDGILLAGTHQAALGQTFTIAGPNYTTIRELVATIAQELGKRPPRFRVPFAPVYAAAWACEALCRPLGISPPLYRRRTEFFHLDRAFDTTKARQLLGYSPKYDLATGIHETARGYRSLGLL